MEKEKMLELYKELYYHEYDHKDKINARIAIPSGIIPLLATGDIYLLDKIGDVQWAFWKIWAIVFLTIFTASLLIALYFVFKALYNHNYGYIPKPKEIMDYRELLEEKGYSAAVIEEEMIDFLSFEYVSRANTNHESNSNRIDMLRFVYYGLVASILFGILCIPAYTLGKSDESEVQKIRVTNSVYTKMEVK